VRRRWWKATASPYAEVAPLHDGWRQRMPVLRLREQLGVFAHDDRGVGAIFHETA
jgi:hypothetical protein